jgi:prophage DNA circulation protein
MAHGFTFDASWGGVRIDVLSTNIRHGRRNTAHIFPKRDGATIEDSGREPFVCDVDFVFVDRRAQEGEDAGVGTYLERFQAFDNLVETASALRFIHPYVGAKLCSISNFAHNASGDGQPAISCSATFTEETSFAPTVGNGSGVQTLVGSHEVAASALDAAASLQDTGAGLTDAEISTAAGELAGTRAVVDNWDLDPDLSARQVHLQMASVNNALSSRLEQLDAASDVDRYPIMKQYTLLQYQVRRAAEAFTSETTRIVTITTSQPLPLRVIAARFYGAREAGERFEQLLELNPSIRNPALVGRGVELKAYARNAEPGAY